MLDQVLRLGWRASAVHLNHGLRPEADEEEQKLRRFAKNRQVELISGKADVAGFARDNQLSIEEAARFARYRFLFEQARALDAQAVLVAHNADDQVETVLMHLLRGAGLSGLKGMEPCLLPNPWSGSLPLVRPLLQVWRSEILAYCQENGLDPSFDPSNLDTRLHRNRLRHELIPFLESINPRARQLIWRTSDILRFDHEVIEEAARQAWLRCFAVPGEGCLALKTAAVLDEMEGIQRRVVRQAVSLLRPGLRDIDFELARRALAAMQQGPSPGRRDLGANLFIYVEDDLTWISDWEAELPRGPWPQMPALEQRCPVLHLPIPGRLLLSGGWELVASPAGEAGPALASALENKDPYQVWLDLDRLEQPLQVRCRRPGDRFRPLGLHGHSLKLSDFLINQKMPARARDAWPVVCSADEIAWIPGLQLAHPFRLRAETARFVHLHLLKQVQEKALS